MQHRAKLSNKKMRGAWENARRYATGRGQTEEAAEDFAQEYVLGLWLSDRGNKGWAYVDWLRELRGRDFRPSEILREVDIECGRDIESEAADSELIGMVIEQLKKMPPRKADIFAAAILADEHSDAARAMGVSQSRVSQVYWEVVERLVIHFATAGKKRKKAPR